jgi:carbon monoxide dehydrogenase subunit G
VFARAAATLEYPADKVAQLLAAPSHPWSVALDGDGGELLAKVGVTIGRMPIYKNVQLKVGASSATLRQDRVMLPVSWTAVGGPPIFPKMEGTLHVEPEGSGATRLTLNARYDPPFGRLGDLIDRALMHQVAQMTMSDFVDRLARALAAELKEKS